MRRFFISLLVLMLGVGIAFTGGQKDSTVQPDTTGTMEVGGEVQLEAPMLAQRVKAGELPPLEQRLPDKPEVVEPYQALGKYGDIFRFGLAGYSDQEQIQNWAGNMGLVQLDYDSGYSKVIPNVAESFEVNEDYTVFTFHLRKGMKWSDGTLFTADDIEFAMKDLMLHPDWAPVPAQWTSGGEPVKFRKIDLYTVEFSFKTPYFDFLYEISDRKQTTPVYYQKAFVSQAHPDYNPNLAADMAAKGLSDWRDYVDQLVGDPHMTPRRWANPDRPTLEAWVIKEPYRGGATQVILERNPYFWQVDTEGRQLPYIDRLIGTIYPDSAGLLLGAIAGNVDLGWRRFASLANQPVLADAAPRIGAELYEVTAVGGTSLYFQLNLTHKDPELRNLFNQKDFRIALSIGFNRQEVIDTALSGVGKPWHPSPFENNPMYHERYATQFLEFDPVRANQLLDGIGLTRRNSNGVRLLPSGKPVSFSVTIQSGLEEMRDQLELMSIMWKENIGVDVRVDVKERSLSLAITANNDHDAFARDENTSWLPGRFPVAQIPISNDSRWAIAWTDWYTSGGQRGEEPPAHIKERLQLYEASKAVTSFEERKEIYHKIADIAADQFEVFGVASMPSVYGLKKTALVNVRPSNPETSQYPLPFQRPWHFFWNTPDGNRPQK